MARAVRGGGRMDAILFGVCSALSLLATVLPMNMRQPVADGLRRTLLSPLVALQAKAEHGRAALVARDSVMLSADSIALERMQAAALRTENDRLRKIIGLGGRLQWGFVPAEALHDRSRGEEFTLWLTAGERAGIKKFSPVLAPEGLVGMVRTVDQNQSEVIVSAHTDFRVSAMSVDESAFGIVQAHLGTGSSRYLLELHGVPFRSSLKPGTLIVSSGIGGVFPRAIPIGTVLGELKNEGWARTYLVRPAVLPSDVTGVIVLHPERVAAGLKDVWSLPALSDSARRSIVTAGDSLAREAARAEAEARRTLVDSAGAPTAADSGARAAGVPAGADSARRDTARRVPAPVRRDSLGRPIPPRTAPVRRDSLGRPIAAPPRRDTARPATATPPSAPTVPPSRPDTTARPPE